MRVVGAAAFVMTATLSLALAPPAAAAAQIGPVPGNVVCDPIATGSSIPIGPSLRGESAVASLGSGLATAARRNGMTAIALRDLLRTDTTARVDPCGQLFYVDPWSASPPPSTPASTTGPAVPATASAAMSAAVPERFTATGALGATGGAFALNSRPGSRRTIYLDFLGFTLTGVAWNGYYGKPDGYRLVPPNANRVSGSLTAIELDTVRRVWLRVSEDYAPFDVNVTTQDPGAAALDRTTYADPVYGTRVAITGDATIPPLCACSGVA